MAPHDIERMCRRVMVERFVDGVLDGDGGAGSDFDPKCKRVFISGPMSGIDHYNASAFAEAHAILRECGAHRVFDPSWEWMRRDEPTLGHEVYLRRCLHELTRPLTDISGGVVDMVQLDGWQESAGAMTEYLVARACGIRCVRIGELRKHAAERD